MASPASPKAPRGPGGFTFIELIVVLAILAFAFTYGILHLDGATGSARLSSAARQVGTTIEFLRSHAIQASRPLELRIDLDRGEWRTVIPPLPSEAERDRRDDEEILVTEPIALPRRIRFDAIQMDTQDARKGGELVITFSPLGEIAPNGFLISLVSDDSSLTDEDARFSIEVNGLTGEVSYTRGYATFEQVVKGDSF